MNEQQIIHHAAHITRCNLLRAGYIRQSCLASTKATTEVLKQLGFLVRPIVVSAAAFTYGWLEMLEAGDKVRTTEELDEAWEQRRAWSTGVVYDPEPRPGVFTGHMVCMVRDRYLCDPSADQMANPEKDLPIKPLVIPFGASDVRTFMAGTRQAVASYEVEDAQPFTIVYSMFPRDRSHRTAIDWKQWQQRFGDIVIKTVRYMEAIKSLPIDEVPELPPVPWSYTAPHLVNHERTPEELSRLRFVDNPSR